MQLNSLQRAVDFIKNAKNIVLKADGSTPATLNEPPTGWTDDGLASYLLQEVRMGNFQDAMKTKGYGSIFLVAHPYADRVLHIRVMQHGPVVFHYVD